jgi:hypothetical protein
MPWRLIGFVLFGAVFLCFIGFNLENRCDVSIGFYEFSQVPVFLTALCSFVLGLFLALPLVIPVFFRNHRKGRAETLQGTGKVPGKKRKKAPRAADEAAVLAKPSPRLAESSPRLVEPSPPGGDHGIR